jgi:hypothetical protein
VLFTSIAQVWPSFRTDLVKKPEIPVNGGLRLLQFGSVSGLDGQGGANALFVY